MTDTAAMHFRRERVRIETQLHEMEGVLQLPNEGYRSRTTDFLNAHAAEFLALTDVDVRWRDADHAPEHHDYLAVAVRHVVMAIELEDLGPADDSVPPPFVASTPPPLS
jgi:hypothetical protein